MFPFPSRQTNADLKISLYVCVHVRTIPGKFRILKFVKFEVCKFREVYKFFKK